jgi:hypothetical protein
VDQFNSPYLLLNEKNENGLKNVFLEIFNESGKNSIKKIAEEKYNEIKK